MNPQSYKPRSVTLGRGKITFPLPVLKGLKGRVNFGSVVYN